MNGIAVSLILGTATPGGGFPLFGGAYAESLNAQEPQLRILAKNPSLQAVTLPAKSYPGQDMAIPSVGSWSYVFARPGLPDEQAYLLAKALHRAEGRLAARLDQAKETTAANIVAASPRVELIHPGTRKYLREAGLLR